MKKIIALGDIHGIDTWKKVVANNTFDVCVFVGDYFDSFEVDTGTQLANFKEIIKFKKEQGERVVLLMGNHDLHYLLKGEHYSGYQHTRAFDIESALLSAIVHEPLINYAAIYDGFLFSHAGVTKTWVEANKVDLNDMPYSINELQLRAFAFNHDRDKSNCGEHKSQGPMWVRPAALQQDAIPGYTQVVGHTRQESINITPNFIFIDSLWNDEFLSIEDGVPVVNKII